MNQIEQADPAYEAACESAKASPDPRFELLFDLLRRVAEYPPKQRSKGVEEARVAWNLIEDIRAELKAIIHG